MIGGISVAWARAFAFPRLPLAQRLFESRYQVGPMKVRAVYIEIHHLYESAVPFADYAAVPPEKGSQTSLVAETTGQPRRSLSKAVNK